MKMLFSAYRLDQYPDAEGFMAQAAMVLESYPADVVLYVTHPRTGLQSTHKFPPTIAEITEACELRAESIQKQKELDEWAEKKRKSDEIKRLSSASFGAPRTANLFVPDNQPRYQNMVDKHNAEPDLGSYFEQRTCSDGIVRNGIWVPLAWWEEPATKKQERASTGPIQVSEHLKALVQRQVGERSE